MKVKSLILTSCLAAGFGLFSTQPVSAHVWHHGVPTVLRGHYTYHLHRKAVPNWGYLNIYAHKMREQDQGDPYLTMTHLRYYKTSAHTYHFHSWAYAPAATGGTPGPDNFTLTKKGHSLWFNHWRYNQH